MAIFHLEFNIVKRSEGKSAVAKAAYHARARLTDERTGDTYDYSHKTDLYGHFILAPTNAPAHIIENSSALWNEVEKVERQKNGQTARYFNVAIPKELNNDDKKKLVLEYCQKNFVDEGMIADIAFHDLDSDNPHAHVMLTLKTIDQNGFGKKNRDWNDKANVTKWRESWANLSNSYLEAANIEERIDHRSLKEQHTEALQKAVDASTNEEKAIWLAKAEETDRTPISRVHRAKWIQQEIQDQRMAEQALRDEKVEEAKKTYTMFKELPLEIVVDVNSFTVSALAEPEEIILPEQQPQAIQKPVLVAPTVRSRGIKSYRDKTKVSKVIINSERSNSVSNTNENTILKESSSQKTIRASKSAPYNRRKHKTTPRQDNIFKRFTLLVVDYIKEKFVWAINRNININIDRNINNNNVSIEEAHDKRIAEKYIFDEVLCYPVLRAEFEKRAGYNSNVEKHHDDSNAINETTKHDTDRFPSRLRKAKAKTKINNDFTMQQQSQNDQSRNNYSRPKPPGRR